MNYGAGENLIAYTEDGTLYYLMQPTDVACDTEDQTIVEEYGSMMEEVTAIASSVKIDADDVHYDADQYVVPVGAILPVTEENLSDLSEQELYLAANEIYARHGKPLMMLTCRRILMRAAGIRPPGERLQAMRD